jgi:hypothetical protein
MDWNAKLQTVLSFIFFFLLSDQNWGKVLHLLILPSVDIIVALKFTFYQMHLGLLFTYLILKFSVMIGLIFILV